VDGGEKWEGSKSTARDAFPASGFPEPCFFSFDPAFSRGLFRCVLKSTRCRLLNRDSLRVLLYLLSVRARFLFPLGRVIFSTRSANHLTLRLVLDDMSSVALL